MNILDKIRLRLVGGWGGILELYHENKRLEGELDEFRNMAYDFAHELHIRRFFEIFRHENEWNHYWDAYHELTEINSELRRCIENVRFWANLQNDYKHRYELVDSICDNFIKRNDEKDEEIESLKTTLANKQKECDSLKESRDYLREHYEKSKELSKKNFQEVLTRKKQEHRKFIDNLNDKYKDAFSENYELRKKVELYEAGGKSKEYVVVPSEDESKIVSRSDSSYLSWRTSVLKRDKICQCCGSSHDLEVHHIFAYKTYPHLRIDVSNGIVLCKDCHNKYHARYGKDGKKNNALTLYSFLRDNAVPFNHSLLEYTEDRTVIYGK